MDLTVRLEAPGDADAVRQINARAFDGPDEARIVDALRGSPGSLSLVACAGERIAGHILFTPVTIEPPRGTLRVAGLAPMAVRPEAQRRGIGSALVRRGVEECRSHGYDAIVVLGHPGYYPRFGFVPANSWGLTCEFPAPPEAFMALELTPDALSGPAGLVRYLREFSGG